MVSDKQIQQARAVSCRSIMEYFNIPEKGGKFLCCNPEHDDHYPSMHYHKDSNKMFCYTCGSSEYQIKFADNSIFKLQFPIDSIGLFQVLAEKSFPEAVKDLNSGDWEKVSIKTRTHSRTAGAVSYSGSTPGNQNSALYQDIYYSLEIETGLTKNGRNFLYSRGFNDETINKARFLSFDTGEDFWYAIQHLSAEQAIKAGIMKRTETGETKKLWKAGGVVIPFYENGFLTYLQLRLYEPQGKLKYINLAGIKKPVYYSSELKPFEQVVICEGVFDALSSCVLYPQYKAIATLGQIPNYLYNKIINNKVYSAFDYDKAGRAFHGQLCETVTNKGGTVHPYPIDFSRYKDLNEFLSKQEIKWQI